MTLLLPTRYLTTGTAATLCLDGENYSSNELIIILMGG